MTADPLWSARRRIARADKHIGDLESHATAYLRGKPYAPVREIHPNGSHEFHKLKIVKSLPDALTDYTFDAITNLRSSLESAAHAIAVAHAPTLAKDVHFPIADTASQLKGDLAGQKGRAFPPDINSRLWSLQPYEGGHGHFLWALNKVRNQSEHRLMIRRILLGGFQFSKRRIISGDANFFEYVEGDEDEIAFAVSSIGAQLEYDLEFSPFIAFGSEVEKLGGRDVVQTLKVIRKDVEGAILALSAARRLGII